MEEPVLLFNLVSISFENNNVMAQVEEIKISLLFQGDYRNEF